MWRRGEIKRWLVICLLISSACAVPLVPWAVRNAITFHEFQPLAPKDAILPSEIDPKGFMAWERTWLYRVRDCYLVPWKLNDEAINLEDIPDSAFDTPEEKERVAAILETYNDDLTLTAEEDAIFAQLASERTARHPLRTYFWIPCVALLVSGLPPASNCSLFPATCFHSPICPKKTLSTSVSRSFIFF